MSLDLNKLENKLDEALSNETSQTLTKFLNDKRMTNNKQQTAVDLFAEKTFNLIELMKRKWVNQEEFLDGMLKARNEAKEMEVMGREMSYSEGYKEGYKRALELVEFAIEQIKTKQ